MKLLLENIEQLHYFPDNFNKANIADGWIELSVSHCGVCRTDAKMWQQGHRDLHLPRVLGHEIVGIYKNNRYAVWPGVVCGKCNYCESGRENLCQKMKIIGFHLDGGFQSSAVIPFSCCIPVPALLDSPVATFAEPTGCIVNAFEKTALSKNDHLLIVGGGTMGLLAALLAKQYGAQPVVIDKNEAKRSKAEIFSQRTDIHVLKELIEKKYDVVMICCADPAGLMFSISKAAKGARVAFFSGLEKGTHVDSDVLNLIHYKEMSVFGSYGLTSDHMKKGLKLLCGIKELVAFLIEEIVDPEKASKILSNVIKGRSYKYILEFKNASEDYSV